MMSYNLLVFWETLYKFKNMHRIEQKIKEIEIYLNPKSVYPQFKNWYRRKVILLVLLWLIGEAIYCYNNWNYPHLVTACFYFLYPYGMKSFRELQIMFYCNFCERLLQVLAEDVAKGKKLQNIQRSYLLIKELIKLVNRTFEWSLLGSIVQTEVQFLSEFYWIAFGLMNVTRADPWGFIICLVPKILFALSLWTSCTGCQAKEVEILAQLQKVEIRNRKKIGAMVSYRGIEKYFINGLRFGT